MEKRDRAPRDRPGASDPPEGRPVLSVLEELRAERERLAASDQRTRVILESAPDAVVTIDARGVITEWNTMAERIFGWSRAEAIGRALEGLIIPPHRRDPFRAWLESRATEREQAFSERLEVTALRRDGEEFPVELTISAPVLPEGRHFTAFARDLTERRGLEQEQRLLSSLVETVEDYGIFTLDTEGRVITWNIGAERIQGYRADEVIGAHFSRFYTPEALAQGRPEADLATARAAGRYAEEGWRVRADGSRFWASVALNALRDASGEVVGYSKITRDLTEQRLLEQRFRAILESAPTAMVMIDRTGSIVVVNRETENQFGYGRDELLGKSVEMLLPERFRARHPDQRHGFFAQPEARRMGAGRDLFGRRRDGSEFPVEIGLKPVETDEGLFVLSAVVDITERKRLEDAQRRLAEELERRVQDRTAQLEVARDAAQSANRAKSEFLANMSHEIRTPLNAVIGLSELVMRSAIPEEQRDRLVTVMDSAETLLALLNDVLDFSKIEAGKLGVEQVPFSVHDTITDTLRSLALRAEHKGLELHSLVDPDIPPVLLGDPGRLRQVISNLVQNAIKFTDGGEVVLRVGAEEIGESALLLVSVADTGIGIAPGDLDRVFEPFVQGDPSTTRRFGGSGLGLAICRQLVELMGGRIGADSAPGEGSTFHFTARFGIPESASGQQQRAARAMAGTHALIVDDDATDREILAAVTRAKGMRPELAPSAADAKAQLVRCLDRGDPISLLLTDLQMPEVDGYGLVEWLRADPRFDAVAVILLTSAGHGENPERCQPLRIAARLLKPIHQSELSDVMARVLGVESASSAIMARSVRARRTESDRSAALRPLRILLAEDSAANRQVALALLDGQGHRVVLAEDGRQALACLDAAEFDVVLMDVQMPVMDGLAATAAIRAREKASGGHLPIVAMTAHALHGDRERYLASGMDDYVSKPVRRRDLFEALARVTADVRAAAVDAEVHSAQGPPEVDWSSLSADLGDDPQLIAEIAAAYATETRESLARLPERIASGDAAAVRRLAHTMNGAMRRFGATDAAQRAHALEELAAQGGLVGAADLLAPLREAIEPILREVDAFVSTEGA